LRELQEDPATDSVRIIIYHDHSGVPPPGNVQPGYIDYRRPVSYAIDLARELEDAAGYIYIPFWEGSYIPTGEAIQWSAMQDIAAVDLELPPDGHPDSKPAGQQQTILVTAIQSILILMES